MTVGCNIFKDKTPMPSRERTEIDTPVRTTQVAADAKAGAMSLSRTGTDRMSVANVERPRRGHDY